jgi:hypothetical protein
MAWTKVYDARTQKPKTRKLSQNNNKNNKIQKLTPSQIAATKLDIKSKIQQMMTKFFPTQQSQAQEQLSPLDSSNNIP